MMAGHEEGKQMGDVLTVNIDDHEITITDADIPDITAVTATDMNKIMQSKGIDLALVHAVTPGTTFLAELRRLRHIEQMFRDRSARDEAWVEWFERFTERYEPKGYHDEKPTYWCVIREEMPWPSVPDEDAEAAMDE